MKSLKELYRIGRGPSSSHTMGPSFVAEEFLADSGKSLKFGADKGMTILVR